MSERSVNENNKLWEAAERVAEKVVAAKKAESEEERRKQKKRIVKLVLLMTLIALIIVFASIAWFTMNRDVGTSGMGIQVAAAPFELAVEGTNVGALSYKQSGTVQSPTYTLSDIYAKADNGTTAKELANGSLEDGVYYTDGSNPKIKWRLTDDYNDKGLGPNSQGTLAFKVIPNSSGSFDVTFSINLEGYTATQSKNTNGSYDVESISLIDSNSSENEKSAVDYLNGHILFFSGRRNAGTDESPIYEYTGFLDPSEFTLSEIKGTTVNATEGTAIPVTIYWVWANTFGQMVFSAADNGNKTPVAFDTTTRADIREYIVGNPTKIFDDMTEANILSKLATETNNEYTFDAETVGSGTNFADLTLGYNKADQKIGTNVRYLLLILDAN